METSHLHGFLKVAEAGSTTRAAASLGISQPKLSRQLSRIEAEIGSALFRRGPRGLILTQAGRLFCDHARRILQDVNQAREDVGAIALQAANPAGSRQRLPKI